ncbi:MAG: hypothetical protein LPJ89_10685 [Hymenobacteraceae bacterium]|nr:hypothetical protein [Hymenobacteraceae bacterium]MDX5394858.1 hypothetical protein [Hymenobacteraceae bacterium]MDX5444233.1 hypothetical protein [Hymenobacteraceae bacterium]MDX5510892.1 hypothetical protein [Hymenobacteraceae bacterium]
MNSNSSDKNTGETQDEKIKRLVSERDEQISKLSAEEQEQFKKFHQDFTEDAQSGSFRKKAEEAPEDNTEDKDQETDNK